MTGNFAHRYIPVIRTRDAELRGFENLVDAAKDFVLPVIELTRSRRSKKNTVGLIQSCLQRLHTMLGSRPYVADLTTIESLQNSQFPSLLDSTDSFKQWCDFVASELPGTCIPVAHLHDPFNGDVFNEKAFRKQIGRLVKKSGKIAIRFPVGYPDAALLVTALNKELGSLANVVLIVDAGFVVLGEVAAVCADAADDFAKFGSSTLLSCIVSSGFPSSVVLPGYGGDAAGKFDLPEVAISDALKASPQTTHIRHGDYALVHPLDFEGIVTAWVPRVDVPLAKSVYYHRYRRDAGGYVKAAQEAVNDLNYVSIPCWADENIKSASIGNPLGKSPAYWISVRINYHITRQWQRLK